MSDDWPSTGTLLATRYRLVTLLETGGMAEIWHARDELLGRPVAIKMPTGAQVAWREARMAARLSHPNIAAVHDYREAVRKDGTVAPFVVMELLAGETVAAHLERETFEWPAAARVGAAVADALAAAHASGVVHRDIKPGNVMLTPTGIKILDFGISVAAGEADEDDTGSTFGTPAYVAPERLDGMPAEPATDVYGVGVLLFEMVTGDPPYPVDTWEELAVARRAGPGTLPDTLPAAFRKVVQRCLADDPAQRPSADQIRFDLTALWLADQPDRPTGEGSAAESSFLPVIIPARPATDHDGQAAQEPLRESFINAAQVPQLSTPPTSTRSDSVTDAPALASTVTTGSRPRRRLVVALTVLALLGTAGTAYVVASQSRKQADAIAPPTPKTVDPLPPLVAPLIAPSTEASTTRSTEPSTTPPRPPAAKPTVREMISYQDALVGLRTVIQQSAARGQIRADVATDLLNVVRPLTTVVDSDAKIAALRRKISDRVRERTLPAPQAAVIRGRVADLERAARM